MLWIQDLSATVGETPVLHGLNLTVKPGEVHAIMGPNGSGKSTLGKTLAGHPDISVTSGTIELDVHLKRKNLLQLNIEERAKEGLFLGFQNPVAIPGVSNFQLLEKAWEGLSEYQGIKKPQNLREMILEKMRDLKLEGSFLDRDVNDGFSGGERKKNELLYLAVLNPRLAILDEIDSGLDVDALQIVSRMLQKYHNSQNALILITHYPRLLEYIRPDFVHIIQKGRFVQTGDFALAKQIEKTGFEPESS